MIFPDSEISRRKNEFSETTEVYVFDEFVTRFFSFWLCIPTFRFHALNTDSVFVLFFVILPSSRLFCCFFGLVHSLSWSRSRNMSAMRTTDNPRINFYSGQAFIEIQRVPMSCISHVNKYKNR